MQKGATAMIEVTRLNGNSMMINSDLIKIAEASPDTMLTLIHGEKLIVRDSMLTDMMRRSSVGSVPSTASVSV